MLLTILLTLFWIVGLGILIACLMVGIVLGVWFRR